MTVKNTWRACAIVAAGLLVLGPAAGAQDEDAAQLAIAAGIDTWSTPDIGAHTKDLSIPAGFFCDDFPGRRISQIPLKGKPIVTAPAGVLGTTDTVVLRTANAVFGADGTATVPIEVVGLSLVGSAPFDVPECGTSYTVVVCRGANQPPGNTIDITHNGSNGGTFDADLAVSGTVSFKNAGGTLLLTDDHVVYLTTSNAHWANQVGSGGIDHGGSVQLDQNCSGQASGPSYPGTSGFHPGWSWNPPASHACPSPPCKVPTEHEGPHPNTLPPAPLPSPCVQPTNVAVKLAQTATEASLSGEATSSDSLEISVISPCQIQVTDAVVTESGGASCTTSDLVVLDDGSPRSFSVVSRDPCVLDL